MALNTGINSLNAGAPDIKYTGKEGPQDPRMASDPNVNAELFQMYQDALQSGQLPRGTTFEMLYLVVFVLTVMHSDILDAALNFH